MPLKAIVENLEGIPETLHGEYKEVDVKIDGKDAKRYVLDIDGIDHHPKVTPLANAYQRVKTEKEELSGKVSAYEGKLKGLPEDFTPQMFQDLRQQVGDKKPEERLANLRTELETNFNATLGEKDTRIKFLENYVGRVTIDDKLTTALIEAGVDKDLMPAARALIREKGVIKLEEDSKAGAFSAVVHTDLGQMPIDRFVKEWVGGEGKPFIPKATGGGGNGGSKTDVTGNPFAAENRNLTAQQELIRQNPEKARSLALQAGVPKERITW
jgi:hypothetical protein